MKYNILVLYTSGYLCHTPDGARVLLTKMLLEDDNECYMNESATAVLDEATGPGEESETGSPIVQLEHRIAKKFWDVQASEETVTNFSTGEIVEKKKSMLLGVEKRDNGTDTPTYSFIYDTLKNTTPKDQLWYLFESTLSQDGKLTYAIKPAFKTQDNTLIWNNEQGPESIDEDKMGLLNALLAEGRYADPNNERDVRRIKDNLSLLGRVRKTLRNGFRHIQHRKQ